MQFLYQLKHSNACLRFLDTQNHRRGSCSVSSRWLVIIRFNWEVPAPWADSHSRNDRTNQEVLLHNIYDGTFQVPIFGSVTSFSLKSLFFSGFWNFTFHAKFCIGFYEFHSQFLISFLVSGDSPICSDTSIFLHSFQLFSLLFFFNLSLLTCFLIWIVPNIPTTSWLSVPKDSHTETPRSQLVDPQIFKYLNFLLYCLSNSFLNSNLFLIKWGPSSPPFIMNQSTMEMTSIPRPIPSL